MKYFMLFTLIILLLATVATSSASLPQSQTTTISDTHLAENSMGVATTTAPDADDSHFVAGTGGDLDQYLFSTDVPDGRLRFDIPITRYYFNTNDSNIEFDGEGFLTANSLDHVIDSQILPEMVTLRLRVFDVDEEADWCPEVDYVFVNDETIYANGQQVKLSGADETWSIPSFRIPIKFLKFPQSKGDDLNPPVPAVNEISIQIDANGCTTSSGYPAWAIEVDWGMIEIASPIRPILFAHGWTGNVHSFDTFENWLADDGIPSAGHADLLEGIYPIPETSTWLAGYVYEAVLEFGVDQINIFAHSKGGLVSRQALRLSAVSEHTENLITFASPHHGTQWTYLEDVMELLCMKKYPLNPVKGELCFNATQEFSIDRVRKDFNYSGCIFTWLPVPHWEGCNDIYQRQPNVKYFSLAANLDEAVRPLASTTYPWNADTIPFPFSVNVDARFNTLHGGLISNQNAYWCAIHLLDNNFYGCPARSVEAAVMSEVEIDQLFFTDSGSLTAGESYSAFAKVDNGTQILFEAYVDQLIDYILVEPGGRVIDPAVAASDSDITYEFLDEFGLWRYRYTISTPMVGNWENRLYTAGDLNFALLGLSDSTTKLYAKTDSFTYRPGESITIEASLTDDGTPLTGATITGTVTQPDDTTIALIFIDNGRSADSQSNDGIYTAQFSASNTNGHASIEIVGRKDNVERLLVKNLAMADQTAIFHQVTGEAPVDSNSNNLYDRLDIEVIIKVIESSFFDVKATLVDGEGQQIAPTYYSSRQDTDDPWTIGDHSIILSFDGETISQHGVDGPYMITDLVILNMSSSALEVDTNQDLYSTAAYQADQFERPMVMVAGGDETVVDSDSNGLYDTLTISLDIQVVEAGNYDTNGRLVDSLGDEIAWATDSFYAPGSGVYQIDFVFDGNAIGKHQVDGPYRLEDLSVFNNDGVGSAFLNNVFTTFPYLFTAFEGGFYKIYLPSVSNQSGGALALQNGDFEQGYGVGWSEYSTNGWQLVLSSGNLQVKPHNGDWAAWLGGDSNEISIIFQEVTIPPANPNLSFWYWIMSEDVCGYDFGGVIIDGSVVVDVFDLCEDAETGGWVERSVYLGAYVGQTVDLEIRAETDGSLDSSLFIDDVALGSTRSNNSLLEPIGEYSCDYRTTKPAFQIVRINGYQSAEKERLLR